MDEAAIGVALRKYLMRYNPKNPDWYAYLKANEEIYLFYRRFNRDRVILSARHVCLWQYIHLHLSSYDAWTLDAIKQYRNLNPGVGIPFPENLRT